MRPVNRREAPRAYTNYRDAADDLVARIGDYCSYCERQIETHLAVEHIQPKSHKESLRNDWTNFLLGCVNCNSCKGKKRIRLSNFFWPDSDNTAMVFNYQGNGRVMPNPALPEAYLKKARATIELVGLDREPGHPNRKKRPSIVDHRWMRRQQAWDLAQRSLGNLARNNSPEVRDQIIETALGRGLFSIWMQVFENDSDTRSLLIRRFTGTAVDCFHPITTVAVNRPGGRP